MPRGDSLDRVLRLLQILEAHRNGLTVKEAHDRISSFHDVNERTVRRDLEILESANVGVVSEQVRDDGKNPVARYKVQKTVPVGRSFTLSPSELLALFFARGMLVPLKETIFFQDLDRFFKRIEALFDPKALQYLNEVSGTMHFEAGPRWALGVEPDTLETVRAACDEGHELKVMYTGANGSPPRVRRLGPQFLYFAQGSLYLIADDLEEKDVSKNPKTFSLPRMRDAEMLETPFTGKRITPKEVFENAFGVFRSKSVEKVRLRFESHVAAYVRERRWHDSQKVIALEGGRVELQLTAGVTPDLIQWVLGFGPAVEILEPEVLRTRVLESAASLLERYQRHGTGEADPGGVKFVRPARKIAPLEAAREPGKKRKSRS